MATQREHNRHAPLERASTGTLRLYAGISVTEVFAGVAEIESALDEHALQVCAANGKWYTLRRNGSTRRWVTRPEDFSIPVKFGLMSHLYIDRRNYNGGNFRAVRGLP